MTTGETPVSANNLISKRPTEPQNFGVVPLFQPQSYYGTLPTGMHGVSNFLRGGQLCPLY